MSRTQAVVSACFMVMLGVSHVASAQFFDDFDGDDLSGWASATGDGNATLEMHQGEGYASIHVDATSDRDNIWWALIKRDVSEALDLAKLNEPHHELRVETRIRTSHAPRRVNLHVNTQRTTDFHTHLMEYDIADTSSWHTISMTTRDFDARPGDTVNGQMAMMDWGRGRYCVDVDYFRVDVVDTTRSGPDRGEPIPYHPPIPPIASFAHHVQVAEDAVIDTQYPDVNIGGWRTGDGTPVLTIDGTRYVLLRWDLDDFAGRRSSGGGIITFTTFGVLDADYDVEEFGRLRIVEIHGGDPNWKGESVTLHRFSRGRPLDEVVNEQMIIDVQPARLTDETTSATVSRPVLQRLIDGETRGILLRPLGPINATLYASEHEDGAYAPALHFDVEK